MSFPKNRRRCQLTLSALLLSGAVLSGCASGEGTASGKDGVAAVPETPVALSSLGFDTARLNASKTPLFLSGRMDAAVVDGASAAQVHLKGRLTRCDCLQMPMERIDLVSGNLGWRGQRDVAGDLARRLVTKRESIVLQMNTTLIWQRDRDPNGWHEGSP